MGSRSIKRHRGINKPKRWGLHIRSTMLCLGGCSLHEAHIEFWTEKWKLLEMKDN